MPIPAPLSTFVPPVGQPVFAQSAVALFDGGCGNAAVLGVFEQGKPPMPGTGDPRHCAEFREPAPVPLR